MGGVSAEMRQLKADTSESLGELQEFLKQTRGKSPQEVLGIVTNSGLFSSIVLSMLLIVGRRRAVYGDSLRVAWKPRIRAYSGCE